MIKTILVAAAGNERDEAVFAAVQRHVAYRGKGDIRPEPQEDAK